MRDKPSYHPRLEYVVEPALEGARRCRGEVEGDRGDVVRGDVVMGKTLYEVKVSERPVDESEGITDLI